MNVKGIVRLVASALGLMLSLSLNAKAEESSTPTPFYAKYNCSIKLSMHINAFRGAYKDEKIKVKVEDRTLEFHQIANTEVQGDMLALEPFAQEKIGDEIYQPIHFMAKTYLKEVNGTQVPQLALGMYYYNKFMPNKKRVHSESVGAAQGPVRLTTTINNYTVNFACENQDLAF